VTQKRSYRQYPKEFKEEALSVATNMHYRWKENTENQKAGIT